MKITKFEIQAFNHCLHDLYCYYQTCGKPYDFIMFQTLKNSLEKITVQNLEINQLEQIIEELDKDKKDQHENPLFFRLGG